MKTAFLALAALLISLLLAEGVVRSLSPLRLGFEYRDGLFVLPAEFEYDPETLPTNSLGFHDLERGPKPGGVRRVALLGDSYVAARSVALPQTVGQRLEAHLQRLSGERWEVLAWGLPGAGQRKQLRWLRRHGPAAQPDVVVTLFLSLNDVRNNSAELTERFQEQAPDIVSVRPGAAAASA